MFSPDDIVLAGFHDACIIIGADAGMLGALPFGPPDMAGLTPQTRSWWFQLKQAAKDEHGLVLRERSARRTCAQQRELYSIGRTPGDTRKVVTGAQGCRSWHVTGNAVDFDVLLPNGHVSASRADYAIVGAMAKQRNGKWGGDFANLDDVGHVEYHPGVTIETVCPNPDHCVDVPATSGEDGETQTSASNSMPWGKIALATAAVAAVGGGVYLSQRR